MQLEPTEYLEVARSQGSRKHAGGRARLTARRKSLVASVSAEQRLCTASAERENLFP